MFYTYLRGLVIFILWTLNGNAHYHNKEKIPSKDENYILNYLKILGLSSLLKMFLINLLFKWGLVLIATFYQIFLKTNFV